MLMTDFSPLHSRTHLGCLETVNILVMPLELPAPAHAETKEPVPGRSFSTHRLLRVKQRLSCH